MSQATCGHTSAIDQVQPCNSQVAHHFSEYFQVKRQDDSNLTDAELNARGEALAASVMSIAAAPAQSIHDLKAKLRTMYLETEGELGDHFAEALLESCLRDLDQWPPVAPDQGKPAPLDFAGALRTFLAADADYRAVPDGIEGPERETVYQCRSAALMDLLQSEPQSVGGAAEMLRVILADMLPDGLVGGPLSDAWATGLRNCLRTLDRVANDPECPQAAHIALAEQLILPPELDMTDARDDALQAITEEAASMDATSLSGALFLLAIANGRGAILYSSVVPAETQFAYVRCILSALHGAAHALRLAGARIPENVQEYLFPARCDPRNQKAGG